VKVWVYRGDRLANGEAPTLGKGDGGGSEEDRRNRRGPRPDGRPGAPGGRGRPGGDRGAPRGDAPPAAAAPAGATAGDGTASPGPKGPAIKRVRKAAAPATGTPGADNKGE